jgi:glutamate--cysteine ligase
MSDLGYTNSAQSTLAITYNSLPDYIRGLHQAITTPSAEYQAISAVGSESHQQLNSNILQIENEFYSTIRPKRTIQSGERPTCALAKRGVEYIEVRALDVNPFSAVGITAEQMRFLDMFLLYCLLENSPEQDAAAQAVTETNLKKVVTDGRRLNLELDQDGQPRLMQDWAEEIFAELSPLAAWLDDAYQSGDDPVRSYQSVLKQFYLSLLDPARTLSGKMLAMLQTSQQDNASIDLQLAALYRQQLLSGEYQHYQAADFTEMAANSLVQQQQIEASDTVGFDQYLQQYFTEKPC